MTNIALSQANSNYPTMWEDVNKLEEIRKLFAPKHTEMEFQYLVGLGKATGLNPFLREIWSVKYDDRTPASVFIGRDGYRKAAQAQPDYDYHQADAVYENDTFEVQDGIVKHSYKLTNRGALIGAYCIAKRHKSSRPMYVFVELKEYSTGKSVWSQKPATMIKKVAESQCLRACFQDLLGGTYGEEEMPHNQMDNNIRVVNGENQTERLKSLLGTIDSPVYPPASESGTVYLKGEEKINTETNEPIVSSNGGGYPYKDKGSDGIDLFNEKNKVIINAADTPASQDKINKIEILMEEQKFDEDRKNRAFDYFKIEKLTDLTEADAQRFLLYLGEK